jgi:hypothetical protein
VASYFVALFECHDPGDRLKLQTLAAALIVYATTSSLGGGTASASYDFRVSLTGAGSVRYNVGTNGAAFGRPNSSWISVLYLLKCLDGSYSRTTNVFFGGDRTLTGEASTAVTGINQMDDIC